MKQVTVEKAALVARLIENLGTHRKIFEEALTGWRAKVIETLDKACEDAKAGRLHNVQIYLPRPTDHSDEYMRCIEMLGMEVGDNVVITAEDFTRFVQDDWGWKRDFLLSNSGYSQTAKAMLPYEDTHE